MNIMHNKTVKSFRARQHTCYSALCYRPPVRLTHGWISQKWLKLEDRKGRSLHYFDWHDLGCTYCNCADECRNRSPRRSLRQLQWRSARPVY